MRTSIDNLRVNEFDRQGAAGRQQSEASAFATERGPALSEGIRMSGPKFEIGLVMAGAISAGAYSAGVVDFIIEALDKYYEAKKRPEWDGPRHDVRVPVLAGASAGGMTAAIIALQAFRNIQHVASQQPPPEAAANRLYSSWVRDIDITRLLETDDPRELTAVQSLLCCKVLDEIVDKAFVGFTPDKKRPWIGSDDDPLRVFLTVTNLRGLPCSFELFGDQDRYGMLNHGDYLDFTVGSRPQEKDLEPGSLSLDVGDTTGANWDLFRDAAIATGAFPIGLRPRSINRKASDYTQRGDCGLDAGMKKETAYPFIAVDGGMINNEPLELARQYLTRREPSEAPDGRNPRSGDKAKRAVVLIDPFPNLAKVPEEQTEPTNFVRLVVDIFSALLDQSRFKLDELRLAQNQRVFSRYVICPKRASHSDEAKEYPIASGVLGGFGGFLQESFRRHDYLLGRRNAQAFLRWGFGLPRTNKEMFGDFDIDDRWLIRDINQANAPTRSFHCGEDSNLPLMMFFRDEHEEKADTPGFPIIPLVQELCEPIVLGRSDQPQPTLVNLDALEPLIDKRINFVARAIVANQLGNISESLRAEEADQKKKAKATELQERTAKPSDAAAKGQDWLGSFVANVIGGAKQLSRKALRAVLGPVASWYAAHIAAQVARTEIATARNLVEAAFKD